MSINEKGIALIKGYEKCKLTAYKCQAGIWTIGYGHTGPDVYQGLTITQERAEELFREDIEHFSSRVNEILLRRRCKRFINENQFAALVSLAFNIGLEGFRTSTVARMLGGMCFKEAGEAMLLWDKVHDPETKKLIVSDGLKARRKAELELFNTPGPEKKKAPKREPSDSLEKEQAEKVLTF